MEPWVESAPYQQIMSACRVGDRTTLLQIVEERLAASQGEERAFWLRVRALNRAADSTLPHLQELAWADLAESQRIARDRGETKALALSTALNLALLGERVDRLVQVLKTVRRDRCPVAADPHYWRDLGLLNMKRCRWRKGIRAFDRAIATYSALSAYEQELYACRLAHFHAWRSICRVGVGDLAQARRDVEQALALAAKHPPQNVNHAALGMAQAELALSEGALQAARTALQQGVMQDAMWKRPRPAPAQTAEADLLAARIARAEGNEVGFAHFCEKALATCRQFQLSLTAARVQAVRAGAPH